MNLLKRIGIFLLATATLVNSQNVIEVLARYSQLSKVSSYITAFPQISALLTAANNFTFLAPTDDAISTWLAGVSNISNSTIEATLTYHLLLEERPIASFNNESSFVPTALSNTTYANVTGGQRVEGSLGGAGTVQFVSGVKKVSNVITADVLSTNGFIHIIDAVNEIPPDELTTITAVNLSYFIDIIAQGHFITAENGAFVHEADISSDLTLFAPNSAAALASFNNSGWNESSLHNLFEYHIFPGLVYSTGFTNGTTLTTAAGLPVLVTVDRDGGIFLNEAKIINPDYLIFNGVMQVIDRILYPNNITRPIFPTTIPSANTTTPLPNPSASSPPLHSNGLSKGAKAGIGIGSCLGAIFVAFTALYLIRRKRRRNNGTKEVEQHPQQQELSNHGLHEVPQLATKENAVETGEPLHHELAT